MKKLILSVLASACLCVSPGCRPTFTGAAPDLSNVSQIVPPKYNIDDKPAPKQKQIEITAAPWQSVYFWAFLQTGASPGAPDLPTDSRYWLPTYEQLDSLDKSVRPKLSLRYIENARDCNHFAMAFYVAAHEWAIERVTHDAPISLAVFICYVKIHPEAFDGRFGGEGLHALALIITADRVAWFYDVQSGRHVKVVEAVLEGSIEPYKIVW